MLVICCGMYRSGSTLQYQAASQLALTVGKSPQIKGYGLWRELAEFEQLSKDPSSIVVVKEHRFDLRAKRLDRRQVRFLYSYRDIRDALVSMFQLKGQPEDQSVAGMWGQRAETFIRRNLSDYADWTQLGDILISRYEVMRNDVEGEVGRIAAHLGISGDDSARAEVARRIGVEKQREFIDRFDFAGKGTHDGQDSWDPVTQLHKGHFNGGESGKWRRLLTTEQQEFVHELAGSWLAERGYEVT